MDITVSEEPTTTAPDSHDILVYGHVITESIIVFCIVLLSLFLLFVLWTRDRLYHNFFNQFVFSLAIGALVFSLMVRPGSIHEEIRHNKLTTGYCGLYLVLLDVEWIVIPYTLIFMSIERIVAIRHPEKYAASITRPARLTILSVPWIFGLFFGIIKNFAMNEDIKIIDNKDHKSPNHLVMMGCYVTADRRIRYIQVVLGEVVGNIIPILVLMFTSILLVIIFCRRRNQTPNTNLDIPHVHGTSVCMTVVLDAFMVVTLIDDTAEITKLGPWVVTHWLFSAVEFLALILAITLLPDIRASMNRMCCFYDVREEYRTLINVNSSTQTGSGGVMNTGESYTNPSSPAQPTDSSTPPSNAANDP